MNSLTILDWDDTLFPTTWILKNSFNLSNPLLINKYIVFFSELDNLLYKILMNFLKHGNVVIVTNAMIKWVTISSTILPNTKKIIKDRIDVISARDTYKESLPGRMHLWKRLIFEKLFHKNKANIMNIISIGDANYELHALINLYKKYDHGKRKLKSIKFMQNPSYDSLIDQLNVLNQSVDKIILSKKHMDLHFNKK